MSDEAPPPVPKPGGPIKFGAGDANPRKQGRGGRVKGTPNKITSDVRNMVLAALNKAGGVEYLERCAKSHPQAFLSLLGRVLPLEVKGTGEGGAIIVEVVMFTRPAQ